MRFWTLCPNSIYSQSQERVEAIKPGEGEHIHSGMISLTKESVIWPLIPPSHFSCGHTPQSALQDFLWFCADLYNLMSFHIPHSLPPSSLTKPISSFSSSSVPLHLLACLFAFHSSFLWNIHGPYPGKMQWTVWTLWEFRGQGGDDCVFMWDRNETLGAREWPGVGILMTAPGYTYILISEILNDVTVQWKIM